MRAGELGRMLESGTRGGPRARVVEDRARTTSGGEWCFRRPRGPLSRPKGGPRVPRSVLQWPYSGLLSSGRCTLLPGLWPTLDLRLTFGSLSPTPRNLVWANNWVIGEGRGRNRSLDFLDRENGPRRSVPYIFCFLFNLFHSFTYCHLDCWSRNVDFVRFMLLSWECLAQGGVVSDPEFCIPDHNKYCDSRLCKKLAPKTGVKFIHFIVILLIFDSIYLT